MIYFYDTCALLNNYTKIFSEGKVFYISAITLRELEGIKTSRTKDDETKYRARKVIQNLKLHRDQCKVVLFEEKFYKKFKKYNFLDDSNDSKIILCALSIVEKNEITFHTDDSCCRELAAAAGLKVVYSTEEDTEEYTGFKKVYMVEDELASFYSKELNENINTYNLLENQYLVIVDEEDNVIDKWKWSENTYKKISFSKFSSKMFGDVKPKDAYQSLAMDSLLNNQITMIRGNAGSGKSYLSFAYLFSCLERGTISKIIIFCNTVATAGSAKLGFYPGSRDEKLLDSQIGNLLASKIGDKLAVEKMIAEGDIVLLPMSDIRGYDTTGMNAGIYISEAQNLDIELMRLALQRIGEDSICILDGDSETQVDMTIYAGDNNGMRRVSKIFRGQDIYGEVTLQKIHRSKIAELAQQM